MHDTLISKDIIETAQKRGKVIGVKIEVGDLGHLPAKELYETLHKMVPDWKISIVNKKASVKCSCGFVGNPNIIEHTHGHSVFVCPKCNSIPEVISGDQIILKEVEVE